MGEREGARANHGLTFRAIQIIQFVSVINSYWGISRSVSPHLVHEPSPCRHFPRLSSCHLMRTWTTTVAIALSLASLAAAESCVIQGASIGRFDLNGLRKKTDYDGISNPDGGDITMNFCGAVTNDPVAGKS